MPLTAPDFTRLLAHGARHPLADGEGTLVVKVLPGAPLSLPSGRIIAMEPYGLGAGEPAELAFAQQVPPGTYPVVLVTAEVFGTDGEYQDTRVAAARLEIRDEPVVSWEPALRPGEDAVQLGDDEFFGYPVDGGTGCFVDVRTVQTDDLEEDFILKIADCLWDAPAGSVPGGLPITMPMGGDERGLVVFATGWGDGSYPTWIGRTADGGTACFLTDFFVLPDQEDDGGPKAAAGADSDSDFDSGSGTGTGTGTEVDTDTLELRILARLDAIARFHDLRERLEGMPVLTELPQGGTLRSGSLTSGSGAFLLVNQEDGDVVVYRAADGIAVWRTGTLLADELLGMGRSNRLVLQDSGDLVVFAPTGLEVWNSGTQGQDVRQAVLGDDGRLVLLSADGSEVWSSDKERVSS